MLKFFRQIRQNLINEGSFKKYLLYAIGEILLVVIGILIALQINNWNENRKAALQEMNYIIAINKEFKENKIKLEQTLKEHTKTLDYCEAMIQLFPISLEKEALDSLSNYLNNSYRYEEFIPSQNTINTLINTSAFQNIQNEKLRNLLIAWKAILTAYQQIEGDNRDFVMDIYDPYFNDNFDYDYNLHAPRTNLQLLQTFKFENLIKERAFRLRDIFTDKDALKKLQAAIDQIIALTESEMNKERFRKN